MSNLIEIGFKVYLKDPEIFCVSLLGVVTAIDKNFCTVKTNIAIKGRNTFTVPRQKLELHEDHIKQQEQEYINETLRSTMERLKKHFTNTAR
tara:strand:+ start:913 stop:1188 length:276 start_codon:yes stop_codon:yes gene_type:complete